MAVSVLVLRVQVLVSLGLLTAGLLLPCIRVNPRMGDYTGVVQALKPSIFESTELSLASGIVKLLENGELFIAAIIVVFSVLFPFAKLGVLWHAVCELESNSEESRGIHFAAKLGKYSMLDVLVMALLVLCLKGLPGDSSVSLQIGAYLFCLSILISMIIPFQIRKCRAARSRVENAAS